MTDADLLDRYVTDRSESAFAALVARHLDLVYSVALRHVRSPDLAADVAQSVFVDLARQAARIPNDTPLVAWLHVVARRTAIDAVRADVRRRTRETTAAEAAAITAPAPVNSPTDWPAIAPLLDEALGSLNPADRTAVLLRYFENKNLREVGAALGASDDAAQKRLSRALDRLRTFFLRRGLVLTASGLATDLSAHALQSAPAALASTISSLAFAQAVPAVVATHSAQALAMTATQKILVATLLTAAIGTSLFEAKVISRQRQSLETLQARIDTYERELASLRRERDETHRKLGALSADLATAQAKAAKFAAADVAVEAALDNWLQKVVRLKQELEQRPELQIPELQFVTAADWLDATKETSPLESELEIRRALNQLRQAAKRHLIPKLSAALERYLKTNNRQPPSNPVQLAPFFEQPIDPAILQQYGTVSVAQLGDEAPSFMTRDGPAKWLITEKHTVDDYYDNKTWYSSNGAGMGGRSRFDQEVTAAIMAFETMHSGQKPATPAQLSPYLHSPIDPAYVRLKIEAK